MTRSPKPRVHWVSPLPPAETDIAHYTARILPELAKAVDLTLWTDAEEWDPALERHCPVHRLNLDGALPRRLVGENRGPGSDVVFLNIGNSWVFHTGILALARRIPSVIVLHDMAIQEMVFDTIRFAGGNPETYLQDMRRWYGSEGEECARKVLNGELMAHELGRTMPGFELALDRAISVLSHTRIAYEAVTAREFLPAYLLDLPFAPSVHPPNPVRDESGPLRLVQFGYIGPNRRLEEVLSVLADLSGEIDFRFDILGKVWAPGRVNALIAQLGLGDRVTQHGFVPEEELDAHLAKAHLVLNLRHPTMGEASGSQLRIWNARAASVVTDQGFYANLPDETVFKIPPGSEGTDLMALIRRFNADRTLGTAAGQKGRTRLEEYHTPTRYVAGIAEIATQAAADAATALRARSANRLMARSVAPSRLLQRRLASRLNQ